MERAYFRGTGVQDLLTSEGGAGTLENIYWKFNSHLKHKVLAVYKWWNIKLMIYER